MNISTQSGWPSAKEQLASAPSVPYAFERLQQDSEGAEVARLEAQNLLFAKADPLAQLPPLPANGAILDVGSGTGFWSQRLAALVPDGRITCLDRSPELLGLARQRLEAAGLVRADYLRQDLRHLELPKHTYALIFTSVTLAHVQEWDSLLAKLTAALQPGGWIACFEPVQQSGPFCQLHPPCPKLSVLMDQVLEVVASRGTDLSVSLKLAHRLDQLGMEHTVLHDFGSALHGEDLIFCLREVFLPLAKAYLRDHLEPGLLERNLEAAAQEATLPHLWLDFRRAVVLAQAPASTPRTAPER